MNYAKAFWILLGIVVLIGALVIPRYYTSMEDRRERIAELDAEKLALELERDAFAARVAEIEEEKRLLETEVAITQQQASVIREEVEQLQVELDEARVNAFSTADPSEYVSRIAEYYPEMANSDWGVIQIRGDNGLLRNYLKVPLGMADAFMFQETRADNLEAQNAGLEEIVTLKDQVITLQERITRLTDEKATIYQTAYDHAFESYMSATADFRELLNQPNFKVDVPKVPALIGCSVLGYFLGKGL